jgi:hypothetical protein
MNKKIEKAVEEKAIKEALGETSGKDRLSETINTIIAKKISDMFSKTKNTNTSDMNDLIKLIIMMKLLRD